MLSIFEIGEKIAVARKLKNLSQSQLAELLAISAQAVGKWERGESMPDIITFGRLAEILGTDLNYFGSNASLIPPPLPEKKKIRKISRNMSGAIWKDADFSGLSGLTEKFSGTNIKNCKFIDSEMSGLLLKGNNIVQSDFSRSDLSECKFTGSSFNYGIFVNCNFKNSIFHGSSVMNSDFSEANLTEIVFKHSNLRNVNLNNTVFLNASFIMSQFTKLIFSSEIKNCSFENCDFSKTEFNGAVIRDTFFKNAKLKNSKFINCKADKLSCAFMKTCKANLSDVEIIE